MYMHSFRDGIAREEGYQGKGRREHTVLPFSVKEIELSYITMYMFYSQKTKTY